MLIPCHEEERRKRQNYARHYNTAHPDIEVYKRKRSEA